MLSKTHCTESRRLPPEQFCSVTAALMHSASVVRTGRVDGGGSRRNGALH